MTTRARLLLDTHVLLWWLTDDRTLHDDVKAMIDDELEVYVSAATVWEISIKQSKGKVDWPADLVEQTVTADFGSMPITADHAMAAGRLPLLHRDPFDRVLVAQAQLTNLTIVTRDPQVQRYDVATLPV